MSYLCAAYAKPAASITWMLDGVRLTNKPPFAVSTVLQPSSQSKLGETLSYLTIKRVSWREGGTYSCLAENVAGQIRQDTELEIQCKCILQSLFPEEHCSKWKRLITSLSLSGILCSKRFVDHSIRLCSRRGLSIEKKALPSETRVKQRLLSDNTFNCYVSST